jgi:hypothetical protein
MTDLQLKLRFRPAGRWRVAAQFWPSLAVLSAMLLLPSPALAVIEALTPLADFIEDADEIVLVEVEQLDPARPVAVLRVTADLKGRTVFRQLPVNLKAGKAAETQQLLARLVDGLPLVLFITHRETKGDEELVYGYSNGTWFQMIGHRDGQQTRWGVTHLEPYLPRTFNGPTEKLRDALSAAISGKQQPPGVDPKVKPGIGPAIGKSKSDENQGR